MAKPKHITQKTFQDPLLHVLAELSDGCAGQEIDHKLTFGPVCDMLGISEDEWGTASQGTLWTHRLTGIAMRNLRNAGMTTYVRKGVWALTEKGLASLNEDEDGDGDDEGDDTEPVAEKVVTMVAKHTIAETQEPLSLVSNHPYSDDEYMRTLALEAIGCLGAYAAKSPTCKECPFVQECQGAAQAAKAKIGADLEREEAEQLARDQARAQERVRRDQSVDELINILDGDEAPQKSPGPGTKAIPETGKPTPVKVKPHVSSVCVHCQTNIPAETEAWWIKTVGVYHLECLEVADP